jgi:zinc transport system permease protein
VHAAHPHEHGEGCGHRAVPHGDHVDYDHDGHLHAPHRTGTGVHYDEHSGRAEGHRGRADGHGEHAVAAPPVGTERP